MSGIVGFARQISISSTGTIPFPMPAVCGHEVSGSVLQVGHRVSEFTQGDDVVVSCRPACGNCYWCLRGKVHLCGNSFGWSTGLLEGNRTGLSRGNATVYRGVGVAGIRRQSTRKGASGC